MDKRIWLGLLFALTIVLVLPFYFFSEPARMASAAQQFRAEAAARGKKFYARACTSCHGENGLGGVGPALNDKDLLGKAHDQTLFDLIRDGIPNTPMPAWGQIHGGPLTDQDILDLVAFIRGWEPTAPKGSSPSAAGDPLLGAEIFGATCATCHGRDGKGTPRVQVPLNDMTKLSTHDDAWFYDVISKGRLDKGMPTWGKVLSPRQINDVIAYLRQWQTAAPPVAVSPVEEGKALYKATNCAACHGAQGEGGLGPKLAGTALAHDQIAKQIRTPKGAMPPYSTAQISDAELENIIAFLQSLK